jgi:carbon monoxide dehydrogenase subunit G
MLIEGSYTFPAPPERVFATFSNADSLCAAIPGCERLIQFGPPHPDGTTTYEARLRLRERIYIADMTVTPERASRRLRISLNGRGPDGAFRGKGTLALSGDNGRTVGDYTLELEAPGLSAPQARALSNGTGKLYASTFGDQLVAQLSAARAVVRANGASSEGAATEELLRVQHVDRVIRTQTLYGHIVAVPAGPPAPFSPLWMQYALGMLAGLVTGLGAIGVAAAMIRRGLHARTLDVHGR